TVKWLRAVDSSLQTYPPDDGFVCGYSSLSINTPINVGYCCCHVKYRGGIRLGAEYLRGTQPLRYPVRHRKARYNFSNRMLYGSSRSVRPANRTVAGASSKFSSASSPLSNTLQYTVSGFSINNACLTLRWSPLSSRSWRPTK